MPADTGQLLQQLFQVLQANSSGNDASRALQRTQSGLDIANRLGLVPQDSPFLQALSQGVPGAIKAAFPSAAPAPPSFPGPWQAISTEHELPLSELASLHQGGMDPGVFSNIMKVNPDLGKQLLSFSTNAGGLATGNLAQLYGGAQAAAPAALMALPADAAALGAASALPGLTGVAAAAPALTGAAAAAPIAGAAAGAAAAPAASGLLAQLGLSAL